MGSASPSVSYRPDIDGIRAIAVLSVVLFHAKISIFSGGFIGVDVFFVISGFLIASILISAQSKNSLNILDFYMRRLRRIVPALIPVTLFCILIGYIFYLPQDFDNLGQQVFSSTFFISNLLFFDQSGYFESTSEIKPLLHTWTLALEAQFYFFFALILALYFLIIKSEKLIPYCFAFVMVMSFALSVYFSTRYPVFNFFLLPSRVWEFLAGALIIYVPHVKIKKTVFANIFALVALALIIIPVYIYDKSTPFPGIYAVWPCLGTALLIWLHGQNQTFVSSLLSSKTFVFIGLISYSWYLWHWPFIVFTEYVFYEGVYILIMATCITLSFFVAVISWRFVETPFRKIRNYKILFIIFVLYVLCFSLAGIYIDKKDGFSYRFHSSVLDALKAESNSNPHRAECNQPSIERIRHGDLCRTNPKGETNYLLWGDSHADAIAPAFYALSKSKNVNVYIATYHGCTPILNIKRPTKENDYCNTFNEEIINFINEHNIDGVFIASAWFNLFSKLDKSALNSPPQLLENLKSTIQNISSASVLLVDSVPTYSKDPHRYIARNMISQSKALQDYSMLPARRPQQEVASELLNNVKSITPRKNIKIITPSRSLCDSQTNTCKVMHNGNVLYYNAGHLSVDGALYLQPTLSLFLK